MQIQQVMVFPVVMYGWMWGLDHTECWAPKNWCVWTVVLEKTLESPLDCEEIRAVNLKGSQSWIFIGRTDAEASKLWPPAAKSQLFGKDPAGKDWGQELKGMMEDEMVKWHYWFSGHEFEQAPGVGDGQGSLACFSLWGCKEVDTTEQQQQLEATCRGYLPFLVVTCSSVLRGTYPDWLSTSSSQQGGSLKLESYIT